MSIETYIIVVNSFAESLKKLGRQDEARFAEAQAERLQEILRGSRLAGQEE